MSNQNHIAKSGNGGGEVDVPGLLIGTRGVARMLNVSQRHIERLDSAQLIPRPVRIGHAKRWRVGDIQRWLAADCPDRATWESRQRSNS